MIQLENLNIEQLLKLKEDVAEELNKKLEKKYDRFEIVNRNGNVSYELSTLLPECKVSYRVVTQEMPHCCGTIVVHVPKNHNNYDNYLKTIKKYDNV